MKILLVSDTHGSTAKLGSLLDDYRDEVQMVFHMGDVDPRRNSRWADAGTYPEFCV